MSTNEIILDRLLFDESVYGQKRGLATEIADGVVAKIAKDPDAIRRNVEEASAAFEACLQQGSLPSLEAMRTTAKALTAFALATHGTPEDEVFFISASHFLRGMYVSAALKVHWDSLSDEQRKLMGDPAALSVTYNGSPVDQEQLLQTV